MCARRSYLRNNRGWSRNCSLDFSIIRGRRSDCEEMCKVNNNYVLEDERMKYQLCAEKLLNDNQTILYCKQARYIFYN
jgi:hypothetical protein